MLTDYSLTSRLQREDADILDWQGTRRSLAYIPPEGTGRINRGVDYRADFYSLGVVFYEVPPPHKEKSNVDISYLLDSCPSAQRILWT